MSPSTGQIVFDGVEQMSSGLVHKTLGPFTAVANHTFHPGTEEADDLPNFQTNWWDNEDRPSRHVSAMEQSFPGFVYLPAEDGSEPCRSDVIDTGRGESKVIIMTRRDDGPPRDAVVDLRLRVNARRNGFPRLTSTPTAICA
jgi:hypothetical protein